MSQMLKSSGAMAAATLTSRLLGMVREMAYSAFMGTTAVASAFILAFQVPNLFRRLLGEGALTAAFIPIFKQKEITDGEAEMWRAANAVISGLVAAAAAVTLAGVLVITVVLKLGTGHIGRDTVLMLELLRLMFPYTLLVCLAAVFIGMANARGHFFVPALGSVVLNVVMIASVWFLAPRIKGGLENKIFALAIGVLIAGVIQAFFQLPSLSREGYRYRWVSPWRDPTVLEVVQKMLPGSIGVAAFQINVLLTTWFSFWFGEHIVATFNYAVRLMELPQGMFGISLATYMLPALSGMAAAKKFPEFRQTLGQGLSYLCFANLIAAAIALGLAEPIVRLIFERGEFARDHGATQRTALALMCLAPGLLLFSMNNILARAFYALSDIRTPMRISVFCLVLNLALAVCLVQSLGKDRGAAGLGAANTLSACINTALLTYALRLKLSRLGLTAVKRALVVLAPSAMAAGAVAWLLGAAWERKLGHDTLPLKLGSVFVPGAFAMLLYWLVALWAGIPAAKEILVLLRLRRPARTQLSDGADKSDQIPPTRPSPLDPRPS